MYSVLAFAMLTSGISSLYHFYSLLGNTTTIEGWEKDKVATLVRRGRIQEVSPCPCQCTIPLTSCI